MNEGGEGPAQSGPGLTESQEPAPKTLKGNGYAAPYPTETTARPKRVEKTRFTIPILLFCITSFTTLLAGSYQIGGNPMQNPADLVKGIPFAFTLLSILFCHEMGHYLTSIRYGVNTSLPYFIPGPWFPFGIGTFGAFIRIKSPIFKKAALLDIGAAGPIAGFIVSIVAVAIGLQSSEIVEVSDFDALFRLGDPLIFSMIAKVLGKMPPEGYDIALNPVAFAGWIGFFITAMNLLPIGQLDGGHIVYALIGRKARYISIGFILILVFLGTVGWKGWFLWAVLTAAMGVRHPPVNDGDTPLDFKHRLIGLSCVIIFILTFMPNPFMTGP